MPLQSLVSEPALNKVGKLAESGNSQAQALNTYWVGQGVGLMNESASAKQVVYDFMEDLLIAWNNQIDQEDLQTHQSSPNVKEREALGAAFTISYFLPDNISSIVYQPRMKGGKIFRIDLETEYDTTWIDDAFVKGRGTTISDIVKVLARGGAKLRKRKPSAKTNPVSLAKS